MLWYIPQVVSLTEMHPNKLLHLFTVYIFIYRGQSRDALRMDLNTLCLHMTFPLEINAVFQHNGSINFSVSIGLD